MSASLVKLARADSRRSATSEASATRAANVPASVPTLSQLSRFVWAERDEKKAFRWSMAAFQYSMADRGGAVPASSASAVARAAMAAASVALWLPIRWALP